MIAYLIQCHSNLSHIPRLVRWLWKPENTYLISVNPRSGIQRDLEQAFSDHPNVFVVNSPAVTWGGESLLSATICGLEDLLSLSDKWNYVFNLSESCCPLKSQAEILEKLEANASAGRRDFISSFGPIARRDWSMLRAHGQYEEMLSLRPDTSFMCDTALHTPFSNVQTSPVLDYETRASLHASERLPGTVICRPLYKNESVAREEFFRKHPLYLGRLWFCLCRETADWVARSSFSTNAFEIMRSTFIPEEAFLQTVLRSESSARPQSAIGPADEFWFQSGGPSQIGDAMLDELRTSGASFARKLNVEASPRIAAFIEEGF